MANVMHNYTLLYLQKQVAVKYGPRRIRSHGTMCRLRANRNDLIALRLSNLLGFPRHKCLRGIRWHSNCAIACFRLLIVEPFVASQLYRVRMPGGDDKNKTRC